MKNNINHSLFALAALLLTSCGVNRYIAPPFTDIEKILKLQTGITTNEVTTVLGIKPYDVVYSFETGSKALVFNYRVKDRTLALASRSAQQIIHGEEAQRGGEDWYNANHRELFLLFKNDTLAGIYGERMFSEGSYLGIVHDRFTENAKGIESAASQTFSIADYEFLQSTYQDRQSYKERASLVEDEAVKKRRRILGYIIGVLAVFGLFSN